MSIQVSIVIPYAERNDKTLELWTQVRGAGDDLEGLLEFPGGKVEIGEEPNDAAIREVMEEVGVRLKELVFFKVYSFPNQLRISVFLYKDLEEKFDHKGYKNINTMYQNLDKVPPNNKVILEDLLEYFQVIR